MKSSRALLTTILLNLVCLSTGFIVLAGSASTAHAQTATSAVPTVLSQIDAAFSSGTPVSNVQLTGTATWYAGGSEDRGSATLTASASGMSQMQLALPERGVWTESQTAIGPTMGCGWAGADSVQHQGNMINCLRPAVWFLPSLSLQASQIPTGVSIADLGMSIVGPGTYRHIQSAFAVNLLPNAIQSEATPTLFSDIGIDPQTFLPDVLTYQVFPDSGSNTSISIQIMYANYQQVNGVQIPFLIQRYVNGALQLQITVTSVQIN